VPLGRRLPPGPPRRYTGAGRLSLRRTDGEVFASRCQRMFKGRSGTRPASEFRPAPGGSGRSGDSGDHFPEGHVSFVILDPLLVTAELMLDLVNTLVPSPPSGVAPSSLAKKSCFCCSAETRDLHLPGVFDVIDGDLDRPSVDRST